MKRCPQCAREYPEDYTFCLQDATPLAEAPQAAQAGKTPLSTSVRTAPWRSRPWFRGMAGIGGLLLAAVGLRMVQISHRSSPSAGTTLALPSPADRLADVPAVAPPALPASSGEVKLTDTAGEETNLPVQRAPPHTEETHPVSVSAPSPDRTDAPLERAIQEVSERGLSDAELAGRSAWELSVLRNGPYARHGYRFRTATLRAYFERQPWYKPVTGNMNQVSGALSATERQNTKRIRDEEIRRGLHR